MSEQDVGNQKFLYSWIVPLIFVGSIYLLLKKYGGYLKDRFFAEMWKKENVLYHTAMKDIKKEHFHSMNYHKSHDSELRNKGLIKILEIGAGTGSNFDFYPANSYLTVVEPNPFFEPLFYENQQKFPSIKMDKFVLGTAEDMKDVPDNSIDVVVSTLVLCSVRSLEATFQEVERILAPGGKFYYWEHVHDVPGTWLHLFQDLLTPLWDYLLTCHLNRNIDQAIAAHKGFSEVQQKRFDIHYQKGIWKLVKVHVMGIATK